TVEGHQVQRGSVYVNASVGVFSLDVFGQLLHPYTVWSIGSQIFYSLIDTFPMPAFLLISGFFAKGSSTPNDIKNLIKKLLLPYLIFQLIYTGYYYLLGK